MLELLKLNNCMTIFVLLLNENQPASIPEVFEFKRNLFFSPCEIWLSLALSAFALCSCHCFQKMQIWALLRLCNWICTLRVGRNYDFLITTKGGRSTRWKGLACIGRCRLARKHWFRSSRQKSLNFQDELVFLPNLRHNVTSFRYSYHAFIALATLRFIQNRKLGVKPMDTQP